MKIQSKFWWLVYDNKKLYSHGGFENCKSDLALRSMPTWRSGIFFLIVEMYTFRFEENCAWGLAVI